MESDVLLVAGLIVAALALPSALAAFSESRPPRVAAVAVLARRRVILAAFMTNPRGYTAGQIPGVFSRVIGGLLH
ncbi:MAG: hypothetical protein KDJ82_08235 [Rhodobacteraceae bacterium]|nr:hypothetical protein [Paracoccaceae bacterium]